SFLLIISSAIAFGLGAQAKPIKPEAARSLLQTNKNAILVDVRTLEEYVGGHIAGAILLPYDAINAVSATAALGADKDREIILYCRSGRRSSIAASTLVSLGYKKVYDLGAIQSWPYGTVKGQPPKR
ncbi:MAG TPA: rhodanese-like domain-containing protein, partial [Rectinemataceae bacterium]